jgi:hypothetical protein
MITYSSHRTIVFTGERRRGKFGRKGRYGIRISRKLVMVRYLHWRILQYLAITKKCYPNLRYVPLSPITPNGSQEVYELRLDLRREGPPAPIILNDREHGWMISTQAYFIRWTKEAHEMMDPDLKQYIEEAPYCSIEPYGMIYNKKIPNKKNRVGYGQTEQTTDNPID